MNDSFVGVEIILCVVIVSNDWSQTRVIVTDMALVNSTNVLLLV